jgi:hypothetical protein
MLEAFERHIVSNDISRKFETAKSTDDKIAICKEYLEKNGYRVQLNTALNDKTFEPIVKTPQMDNIINKRETLRCREVLPNHFSKWSVGDTPEIAFIKDRMAETLANEAKKFVIFTYNDDASTYRAHIDAELGVYLK